MDQKRLDPQSQAAKDLATGRYIIREMTVADIRSIAITWMKAAGWNPGIHDAEAFFTADPRGFLVGELDGKAIACVSAVRYDDHFGFFGCYIVDEAFRGKGYGMALHEAGRRYLPGGTAPRFLMLLGCAQVTRWQFPGCAVDMLLIDRVLALRVGRQQCLV